MLAYISRSSSCSSLAVRKTTVGLTLKSLAKRLALGLKVILPSPPSVFPLFTQLKVDTWYGDMEIWGPDHISFKLLVKPEHPQFAIFFSRIRLAFLWLMRPVKYDDEKVRKGTYFLEHPVDSASNFQGLLGQTDNGHQK